MTQVRSNRLFKSEMSPPRLPAGGAGGADPHEAARPLGKSSVWGRASPSCCVALGTWLPSLNLTFPSRTNGDTRVRRAIVRTQAESERETGLGVHGA